MKKNCIFVLSEFVKKCDELDQRYGKGMINSNVDYKNDSNWAGNSTQKNNECQDKHESVESEYQGCQNY